MYALSYSFPYLLSCLAYLCLSPHNENGPPIPSRVRIIVDRMDQLAKAIRSTCRALVPFVCRILCELGSGHVHSAIDQIRRPPIVKGGSPAKKRHMRSPPPFALHLQYAPKSGSDWKPSCGITPPLPSKGNLPETVFPRYMPTVGPSDDSALNPGMFISCSFRIVNFIRHNTAAFFSQVQRQNTLLSPGPRIQQRA
jgi:hypothetical protein